MCAFTEAKGRGIRIVLWEVGFSLECEVESCFRGKDLETVHWICM